MEPLGFPTSPWWLFGMQAEGLLCVDDHDDNDVDTSRTPQVTRQRRTLHTRNGF